MPRTPEDDELVARFGQAKRATQAGAGQKYLQGQFSPQFYGLFSTRLNECSQTTGETPVGMPTLDMAIQLAADGHVLSALVKPHSKLTDCFAISIARETFAIPPTAGFWVPVRMRFTTK